jgi:hypothetical protein
MPEYAGIMDPKKGRAGIALRGGCDGAWLPGGETAEAEEGAGVSAAAPVDSARAEPRRPRRTYLECKAILVEQIIARVARKIMVEETSGAWIADATSDEEDGYGVV